MNFVVINKQQIKQSTLAGISFLLMIMLLASCTSTPEPPTTLPSSTSSPAAAPPAPEPSGLEEIIVTSTYTKEKPTEVPAPITVQSDKDLAEIEVRTDKNFSVGREEILSRRVDPSMVFKHYGVNPTIDTLAENTSTFSVDVDAAAYNISRGFLQRGVMPDPAAVRVEEFVNAFDYGYQSPKEDLFSLHAEVFPSPYRRGFHVLHLGVKAAGLDRVDAKSSNLTFLIDVSGSMERGGRLRTVQQALRLLLDQLGDGNSISIVTYTDFATLVLEPTDVRYREKIVEAINSLVPQSSTNIQAGLELAYQVANKSYHPDVNNRIILCSDGVANGGETNPELMMARVSAAAQRGIYLNTIGVGMGNYNDVILETLAKQGQGQYAYVNSLADAKVIFGERLISSLQLLARDVRLQVEFDTDIVESYRLLGYENRAMDNSDFNNVGKDAGEVGVGHSVTAVYEIKFRSTADFNSFGSFRLAYKEPSSEQLNTLEKQLPASIVVDKMESAAASTQLSYLAAAFAEKLRGGYWSRTYSYVELGHWLDAIKRQIPNRQQGRQLQQSLGLAAGLDSRLDPYEQRVSLHDMSFDRVPVLD